jgi:DNA-binding NtrC family response regulator
MEPKLTAPHLESGKLTGIRLLALVRREMQAQIRRQLAPVEVRVSFISRAAELSHVALSRSTYQVALLPAVLPGNSWWSLWGEIALLHPRPEVLVYAHAASFQLWSGVLEAGGYDVLVEPFSAHQLQQAVLRAAVSFTDRLGHENNNG